MKTEDTVGHVNVRLDALTLHQLIELSKRHDRSYADEVRALVHSEAKRVLGEEQPS